jgi:hypothetical protein
MTKVLGLFISHAGWIALESTFSVINHLKDELQHFKRGSRSVIEYSPSFKALCDQLASMGSPTNETNKVH